jgi:adenylosuccinate lyase
MEAVKAGGDRQELHEVIREQSLTAWAALQAGEPNPLMENILADERLMSLVDPETARRLLDASDYVGDAPERAKEVAGMIRKSSVG